MFAEINYFFPTKNAFKKRTVVTPGHIPREKYGLKR